MYPDLPQKLKELQQSVRDFVEEKILPRIMEYEWRSVFPREMFRDVGREGFFRAHVSKEHGGLGLGTLAYCLVSEELAKAGAGMTHNGQFQTMKMLIEHGTEIQNRNYLPQLLSGMYLAATAITEPTLGSSFTTMQTNVKMRGNDFVLNGVKTLINDAAEADMMNVFATGDAGISVFIVDKGTKGYRILKKLDPIGMRSSPIYELEFKQCRVSSKQLVGGVGEGLKAFFSAFNFSRLGNASAAIGMAQAALDKTMDYIKKRQVGTRTVAEFQGIRWALAELITQLEAARLLRDRAALSEDKKQDISLESSQAKLICVEVANRIVGDCIQITGRYGCLRDNLFEMYLRDARVLGIAGGSLEIMKNNIAKRLIDV